MTKASKKSDFDIHLIENWGRLGGRQQIIIADNLDRLRSKEHWDKWVDAFEASIPTNDRSKYQIHFDGGEIPQNNFMGWRFPCGVAFFQAQFRKGDIRFISAQFCDGNVWFNNTQFNDGIVRFDGAQFGTGDVSFLNAQFGKGEITFGQTNFGKGNVSFESTNFGEGDVWFDSARTVDIFNIKGVSKY